MSDHLFGLSYRQKTGKPWIAHFSDPWVENPFNPHSPWLDALNRRWERRVIERADAVVFTSPETIDLVMEKYPARWREKVYYLPHCYDSALFERATEPASDRYVIRYLGSFYGARSPRPLYEAVEQIARRTPRLLSGACFELIGRSYYDPNLKQQFPGAAPFIRALEDVNYDESLRLMSAAQCLLVIDAPAERSVFFPSKLVDYIGAGRFILALSPPGASARIVGELGGGVADPSDPGAVRRAVTKVLEERPRALPRSGEQYEKTAVSAQFSRLLHAVLQRRLLPSAELAEPFDGRLSRRSDAA
jgi:glycosyltransferase involved in cell wall biosynthesis